MHDVELGLQWARDGYGSGNMCQLSSIEGDKSTKVVMCKPPMKYSPKQQVLRYHKEPLQPLLVKLKLAQLLIGGNIPSICVAVLGIRALKQAIFSSFVKEITQECGALCQRMDQTPFRSIPVTGLADITWGAFTDQLKSRAPKLFQLLTSVVSVNNHRNISKVGASHHPGICAAVAVLLKERSREMCGLQSIVSVLMYSCNCEKQVNMNFGQV